MSCCRNWCLGALNQASASSRTSVSEGEIRIRYRNAVRLPIRYAPTLGQRVSQLILLASSILVYSISGNTDRAASIVA